MLSCCISRRIVKLVQRVKLKAQPGLGSITERGVGDRQPPADAAKVQIGVPNGLELRIRLICLRWHGPSAKRQGEAKHCRQQPSDISSRTANGMDHTLFSHAGSNAAIGTSAGPHVSGRFAPRNLAS
jgi:hypothetical protein